MKETVNRVTPERTEGVAAVIVRVECAPDPARLPCRSSARPKDTRIRPTTSRRVRTRFASVSTTLHRGSFLSFAAKPQTVKAPMESPRSSPATAISATAPWRRAWAVLMSKEGVLMRPLPLPEDWLVAEFWEHCNLGELPLKRRSECRTWRHRRDSLAQSAASIDGPGNCPSGMAVFTPERLPHQPLLGGFPEAVSCPFVVEMDEDVRMVSGFRGLEPAVQVVFETVAEGIRLPFFGPRSKKSRRP
jgi:hypothetical protein